MKESFDVLNKIHTPYVCANLRKCKACWKCMYNCPEKVIGKVGFLWHKHIVIKNAGNCIGCKKCIRICPYGVFSEKI
ncbi:MAG: 4Fe-4S binding protein [Prevotellaceae bacterium]|jgi:2-oxoglutarate ferredoxin oxidoreductase subunit delta|nr:4Fe-4S binding protein [Prevotellaceae bacterium]